MRDYDLRPVVKVRRREAQDGEAPVDDLVLAAVVSDQPFTVVSTVEFDHQAARRKVKVGPSHEATLSVVEIGLHLGPGQARLAKKPPQPGLHGRFGRLSEPH